ncbi:MAG TPA: hypothetical protein VJ438_00590 [Candidatus Nanoarchaeia archaeon]|nr:hypothetical protein [Candidatus Nanoarchaeia archaeon]
MDERNYYREFKTSFLGRIKARLGGRIPQISANILRRKSILEMLCQDGIFEMVKKGKLKNILSKLSSPNQLVSSGC